VFALRGFERRPVVAVFDRERGSSDGGGILLAFADRRLGLTAALRGVQCIGRPFPFWLNG